ncbi:MAG: hypothetical protein LUD51_02325 [Clostridia bacterium]|nr:hypothetical protein [Clostridia bacterium]
MSMQDIVDRIISDASAEAEETMSAAKAQYDDILSRAEAKAEKDMADEKAVTEAKIKSLKDGYEASARLDAQKILLAEKRAVIDSIYDRALTRLVSSSKEDTVRLSQTLLEKYAEEGDEIIFADGFKYVKEVSALQVVKDRNLKVSFSKASFKGGFILSGKSSDKDLSYEALLAADREQHEAEIASRLFHH